jgi:DNA-binding NarL/FixJ family response regulator
MEKLLSTEGVGHQEPTLRDLIWVKGTPSIASTGLARILEREFRVHRGPLPPAVPESPSAVLCCLEGGEQREDVASLVRGVKEVAPEAAVLVLSPSLELPLVCAAVSAGARGFLHTGMPPQQLARALSVVLEGEMALPRELLEAGVDRLNEQQRRPDLSTLKERQLEILRLAAEGLSNAQIAKRLYLSESTVKQHLRGAYKALGVKNRQEASRIVNQARQQAR